MPGGCAAAAAESAADAVIARRAVRSQAGRRAAAEPSGSPRDVDRSRESEAHHSRPRRRRGLLVRRRPHVAAAELRCRWGSSIRWRWTCGSRTGCTAARRTTASGADRAASATTAASRRNTGSNWLPATAFTSAPIPPMRTSSTCRCPGNGGQHLWRQQFPDRRAAVHPADAAAAVGDDRRTATAHSRRRQHRHAAPAERGDALQLESRLRDVAARSAHTLLRRQPPVHRRATAATRWTATQRSDEARSTATCLQIMGVNGSQADDGEERRRRLSGARSSPSPSRRSRPACCGSEPTTAICRSRATMVRPGRNVADAAARFPANYYAQSVEPSHFAAGTAYAAFDGHHPGDYKPYLFKTTDFGQTWTSIAAEPPVPRPHQRRQAKIGSIANLLFVGTEFGSTCRSTAAGPGRRSCATCPRRRRTT